MKTLLCINKGLFFTLLLHIGFAESEAATKKAAPAPTFSVTYDGGGSIQLDTFVQQPSAGNCNITASEKKGSITGMSWVNVWNKIPLKQSNGRPARSSKVEGFAKNDSANIYNLSGCPGGYNVNNCIAPSTCAEDAGSCSAKDVYQTPGYPVMLTINPEKKKKGRWLVTVAGEGAAFSPCASGVINNSFFEDSPTTAKFHLISGKTKKTSILNVTLVSPLLDCSESVSGLNYTCQTNFSFSGTIKVTGNVVAASVKK